MNSKLADAIWGHCVGDAMGLPVEFSSRASLRANPVVSPRAFGTFHQPAGTWSDDTSLSLGLLDSLRRGLDYIDIMRNFSVWLNQGEFTPHGETFDVGRSTQEAIRRFDWGIPPLSCGGSTEQDNGNGALMRILPTLFYLRANFGAGFTGNKAAMSTLHNVCALTHAHPRSHVACGIYLSIADQLFGGLPAGEAVSTGLTEACRYYAGQQAFIPEIRYFWRLREKGFDRLPENDIHSSGYVVDTLEAAIWCLLTTNSYRDCILRAVNLGEDTDTVAAVAGGLAGLLYGRAGIPTDWMAGIARPDLFDKLCQTSF